MVAYVTADDVNTYLGESMSDEQQSAAEALVAAASAFVDRYTGRTWTTGTVTGEVVRAYGGIVRLAGYPIAAVTSVTARWETAGSTVQTLAAGSTYDVLDSAKGVLAVSVIDGTYVTVGYTTAPAVPEDIKAAVTMLVAAWVQPAGDASGLNLSKLKAGSVELTWRDAETASPAAMEILNTYRPSFAFA